MAQHSTLSGKIDISSEIYRWNVIKEDHSLTTNCQVAAFLIDWYYSHQNIDSLPPSLNPHGRKRKLKVSKIIGIPKKFRTSENDGIAANTADLEDIPSSPTDTSDIEDGNDNDTTQNYEPTHCHRMSTEREIIENRVLAIKHEDESEIDENSWQQDNSPWQPENNPLDLSHCHRMSTESVVKENRAPAIKHEDEIVSDENSWQPENNPVDLSLRAQPDREGVDYSNTKTCNIPSEYTHDIMQDGKTNTDALTIKQEMDMTCESTTWQQEKPPWQQENSPWQQENPPWQQENSPWKPENDHCYNKNVHNTNGTGSNVLTEHNTSPSCSGPESSVQVRIKQEKDEIFDDAYESPWQQENTPECTEDCDSNCENMSRVTANILTEDNLSIKCTNQQQPHLDENIASVCKKEIQHETDIESCLPTNTVIKSVDSNQTLEPNQQQPHLDKNIASVCKKEIEHNTDMDSCLPTKPGFKSANLNSKQTLELKENTISFQKVLCSDNIIRNCPSSVVTDGNSGNSLEPFFYIGCDEGSNHHDYLIVQKATIMNGRKIVCAVCNKCSMNNALFTMSEK